MVSSAAASATASVASGAAVSSTVVSSALAAGAGAAAAAAFSFQDFLAGGWMKEKLAEVTGDGDRAAEAERQKRLRREV